MQIEINEKHAKDKYHFHERNEDDEMQHVVIQNFEHSIKVLNKWKHRWKDWKKLKDKNDVDFSQIKFHVEQKCDSIHVYQFDNIIIVENENDKMIKKYDISHSRNRKVRENYQNDLKNNDDQIVRQKLKRMRIWIEIDDKKFDFEEISIVEDNFQFEKKKSFRWRRKFSTTSKIDDFNDDNIRFIVDDSDDRRMNKQDFITFMRQLNFKVRIEIVENNDVSQHVKQQVQIEIVKDVRRFSQSRSQISNRKSSSKSSRFLFFIVINQQKDLSTHHEEFDEIVEIQKVDINEDRSQNKEELILVDSNNNDISFHFIFDIFDKYFKNQFESIVVRRNCQVILKRKDSDDDDIERISSRHRQRLHRIDNDDDDTTRVSFHHAYSKLSIVIFSTFRSFMNRIAQFVDEDDEIAAEKQRRLAAFEEFDFEEKSS